MHDNVSPSELRTLNAELNKGLFIMLEGTDGSGKTTQTALLVERLEKEGYPVKQISFPQYGTPSAHMVEAYLRGDFGTAEEVSAKQASLFYAIDRFAAKKQIEEWINEGNIVIANRYVASNMGHQGGKISDPVERQAYFDWNYELEYTIFTIPKPDVNIILHVPTDISKKLVDAREEEGTHDKTGVRDIHEENIQHLRDAEQAYLDIAGRYDEFSLISCVEKETLRSREDIHNTIWELLSSQL